MVENLIEKMVIPSKFQDENGQLRVNELLKSYQELEKKMSHMVQVPTEDAAPGEKQAFYRRLGVPETPEAYQIEVKNELMASDPEVNQYLFNLGFTNKQVQAVYDLAAEKIMPVIQDLAQEYEASHQRAALVQYFGGNERWCEVSRQIAAWAKGHLPTQVVDAMATTYEGVMALYNMMQSGEPGLMRSSSSSEEILDEEGLKKLMMSPKYWREQDPATLKKVSDGFRRLYPGSNS